MDIVSGLISNLCGAVFTCCLDCTMRKAAYISKLKDNVDELENDLQKLIHARNDVRTRVVLAEQQQMQPRSQVQGWLSSVEKEETEVRELIRSSSQEIEKLCLGGYCSKNCRSSYKFGKKVATKMQIVAALKNEGQAFEVVAERVPEAAVDERPIEPVIVGLQLTFDKVWRCLVEKTVGIIGLYGMGGVGKTTLLKQINNKFLDTPDDFDVVIWVVVSKDLQLQRIQETIGKKLGLLDESLKNSSVEENASTIFKILSKKKFVLLLDDIWERVDIEKVGIPHPSPATASKIVFTTRSFEVCGLMEAEKNFRVECLTDDEASILFQKKVGKDTLNSHPDILALAESVAKECGGLPLALITIGRAMSSKTAPEEWRHAIKVLKVSGFKISGMEKKVYDLLKFSYDSLSSNKIRLCLLYCSLFSEDCSILKEHLVDCWIDEGFLAEDDVTDQQNQGYAIIGDLIRACLLEEDKEEDRVKMHDVIRDMAIWIACEIEKEKEHFFVQAGAGLTEAPKIEKWEGVRRMSLMQNKIECLSEVPTCTNLLTLFLNYNNLRMITNDFFKFMRFLVVLDLSYNFELNEIPSGISKLVSLQHLDLSATRIKELPIEVEALVNLKYLGLQYTPFLHTIPRQFISTLSKLRILKMFDVGYHDSRVPRKARDNVLAGGGELLVMELLGLKYLNVLDITLRSHHALDELLYSNKLQSCIRSLYLDRFEDSSKSLNVVCLADIKHLRRLAISMFKNLEELTTESVEKVQKTREPFGFHSLDTVMIDRCGKLRDLTWLIFVPNLKRLTVLSCSSMGEILSVEKLSEVSERLAILNPFQQLKYFALQGLENLKSIYWKALPFPHLKEILVYYCSELKKLPLDSNSAKERKIVIKGQKEWWKKLQWEDEATQNAFLPCFESYLDDETTSEIDGDFWHLKV